MIMEYRNRRGKFRLVVGQGKHPRRGPLGPRQRPEHSEGLATEVSAEELQRGLGGTSDPVEGKGHRCYSNSRVSVISYLGLLPGEHSCPMTDFSTLALLTFEVG